MANSNFSPNFWNIKLLRVILSAITALIHNASMMIFTIHVFILTDVRISLMSSEVRFKVILQRFEVFPLLCKASFKP